ncbi:hypothetical protein MTO96_008533 [Rhipicephalus appendiculatus]
MVQILTMWTCRLCLSAERRQRATSAYVYCGIGAKTRERERATRALLHGAAQPALLQQAGCVLVCAILGTSQHALAAPAPLGIGMTGGPATDGGGGGAAWGSSRCHSGPPPVNFFRAVRLHGRRSSSAHKPASSSPIDSDITRLPHRPPLLRQRWP